MTGIPRACDAHFSMAKVEDDDADLTMSNRQELASGEEGKEAALTRTNDWFKNVFTGEDHRRIWASTETNQDFSKLSNLLSHSSDHTESLLANFSLPLTAFTIKYSVYGLYLSDLTVFNPLENELVMLSCVLSQGGRVASLSHFNGLRLLGVNESDAEGVQKVIEIVGKWMGNDVSGWVKASEVAHNHL